MLNIKRFKNFNYFLNEEYSGSMFDIGDIVKIQFDNDDSNKKDKIGEIINILTPNDRNRLYYYEVKFEDGGVKKFLYYQMKLIKGIKNNQKKFKVGDTVRVIKVDDFKHSFFLNKVGQIIKITGDKYKVELNEIIPYDTKKTNDLDTSYQWRFNEDQLEIYKDKKKLNIDLREAIFDGDFVSIKLSLDSGADPNLENGFPLIYSCAYGRIHSVSYLINKGANVNIREGEPLIEASREGHFNIVEFLLKKNANPRAQKDKALRLASENGHLGIVKLLIKAGCELISIDVENILKKTKREVSESFLKDIVKYDPELYDIIGKYVKIQDIRKESDKLFLIGFPSGQMVEVTREELDRLRRTDLISTGKIKRYQKVSINNYGFKDENYQDILDALIDMQMMDGDTY